MTLLRFSTVLLLGILLAACESGPESEPPADWETDGENRWWRAGVDTSEAFRDLSDFQAMGLSDRADGMRPEGPAVRNVQRRFVEMYRNHPEVVDSLFAALAVPIIERGATPGHDTQERQALEQQVSRSMRRHFTEPRARVGRYDPPAVPDSLREAGIAGTISLQIYLDEEGRPLAIELLEGVHPTMDAIVLRNYSERSWRPGYLRGDPIRAWTRSRVTLQEQP